MKILKFSFFAILCSGMFFFTSCGDDEEPGGGGTTTDDPISSFQLAVGSDADFLTVTFTNFSQNATSYAWEFGDGGTSDEENPVYTYGAPGEYTITLTATNDSASKSSTKTVTLEDPDDAFKALTGDVSKTWKLYREGTSMSLGPDAANATQYWEGLTNDGSRPCLYLQEFTFHRDGTYDFNDNGMFWAEFGVFNNVDGCDNNTEESCFDATAANMVNACGDDVSDWLSGTHAFEFDPVFGDLTLNGQGAWIGIPKLGTSGENITPVASVSTKATIEKFTGYDLLHIEFLWDGLYWPITYVNYSDASLEPELKTVAEEFGEDLDDISPDELSRTFVSNDASEWVLLDTIASGSLIAYGVDNPDGSGSSVGQFDRIAADFQELQFQTGPDKFDINFENLSTISLDIYIPSSNDFSTTLTKQVIVGFGDRSKTEQWWTDLIQYENDGSTLPEDEWVTVTFDITDPSFSSSGSTPKDRNDMDMVFINLGGSGHPAPGTYYIRNFVIN